MDILNITEKTEIDESIERCEYHSYEPITGTDLNRSGEIRINIETQDLFTHPSKSYLVFDGKLVKNADDAVYADADVITLTNNAMMHFFNNIKYQLSGQEIESLFHPGQATTMLGLLKFPDDIQKSTGLNQLWFKYSGATVHRQNNIGFGVRQQYIIQKPDPNGKFSFRVPLKHIFGFCDDYEKVVYGFKHQLTLVRKDDKRFSETMRLMPERLFCRSFLGICLMCFQMIMKNLHYTKQLNQNQVSQSVTEWFNTTRSQSHKREISPGDCR